MNLMKMRFELHGCDETDLQRRIATFRRALGAQRGAIVEIQPAGSSNKTRPAVLVTYRIPLATGEVEVPRASSEKTTRMHSARNAVHC